MGSADGKPVVVGGRNRRCRGHLVGNLQFLGSAAVQIPPAPGRLESFSPIATFAGIERSTVAATAVSPVGIFLALRTARIRRAAYGHRNVIWPICAARDRRCTSEPVEV